MAGSHKQIAGMFDRLAARYDFMNFIVTGGIDRLWRKETAVSLADYRPKKVLDLAIGTADLTIEMLRSVPSVDRVVGLDLSPKMMQHAADKLIRSHFDDRVQLVAGEAEHLPFEAGSFDAVTCSFGVRNFENLPLAYSEIFRVLRPGGVVHILELSIPRSLFLRSGYKIYTHTVLPLLGRFVARRPEDYRYLVKSIEEMPQYDDMVRFLLLAGFTRVGYRPLSGGIATLFIAEKGCKNTHS